MATVDETGKVTLTGKTSSGIYITAKAMNGAVSDSYKLIVKPNILKINPTHTYGDDVLYVLSGAPLTEFTKDGGSPASAERNCRWKWASAAKRTYISIK